MNPNRIIDIVTELIESPIRYDNERLIQMNMDFIRQSERQRDTIRRLSTLNRMQSQQIGALQSQVNENHEWQGVQYAVIREYLVNNPEQRERWEEHFSFHDETFEAAVRDNEAYGVQYNGFIELEENQHDQDMLDILAADTDVESNPEDDMEFAMQEEIDDIANNWL